MVSFSNSVYNKIQKKRIISSHQIKIFVLVGPRTVCDYLFMFNSAIVVKISSTFVPSDISMIINIIYEVVPYIL